MDVPKIANLVFLRQVRSRILYEQMIGRATRLCPEINKERFRIFDAVDLYSKLKDVTDMKPVVVNPLVTFEQLVKEVLEGKEEEQRRESIGELLAKLQRKKRTLVGDAEESFLAAAGMPVADLARFLKVSGVGEVAEYLKVHDALASLLDRTGGSPVAYRTVVSETEDELREVTRGYGKHGSRPPGDYLQAFRAFVETNLNKLPALLAVTQRPRDLTREDLRKLKLALDQEGFSESPCRRRGASRRTRTSPRRSWATSDSSRSARRSCRTPSASTTPSSACERSTSSATRSRSGSNRIAKQLKLETVVDHDSFEQGQFKSDGGFARMNKAFDGKLEALLGELAEEVWKDAG